MAHVFYVNLRYMGHDEIILTANLLMFITLLIMALLLCIAARFKGMSSNVMLIVLLVALPDFIYFCCDFFNWHDMALLVTPMAYSANLTIMPFLLLLAHRVFNPYYRFRYGFLLHFLPSIVFTALVAAHIGMMSAEELGNFLADPMAGYRSMLVGVNFTMITAQLAVYCYLIFTYLRKVKHYILNNVSRAEASTKVWIPRFITFIVIMVIISLIGNILNPYKGFKLFYITNMLAIAYIIYSELQIAFAMRNNQIPDSLTIAQAEADFITANDPQSPTHSEEDLRKLEQYAEQVEDYLRLSEAYVNPNLSLKDVATATGISSKNVSRAINTALNKSFYDLINGFRVEKSKNLLLSKKERGLTLETIAEQCGFNSQITYCNAFKRAMGQTTLKWLKQQKESMSD